jgi:hypothetical protein
MSLDLGLWIILAVLLAIIGGPGLVTHMRWRWRQWRRRRSRNAIEVPFGARRL